MLPHLISKLCEYSIALCQAVWSTEELENVIRKKGRYVTSDWLLKQAILPFNQSDY